MQNTIIIDESVSRFLDKLITMREQAFVTRHIELLKEMGATLAPPHSEQVQGKLRALRFTSNKKYIRLFYFSPQHGQFILVHGIAKKSNKIPQQEIETALRRMKDYEVGVPRENVKWDNLSQVPFAR